MCGCSPPSCSPALPPSAEPGPLLLVLPSLEAEGCPQLALLLARHWRAQGLPLALLCLAPQPAVLRPEFEAQREELMNAAGRVFASRLDEADLKEISAFFKTPAGGRYVSAQPKVMEDLFGEMQAWSRRLSEFMMTRVRAELKKKNIDF